mmetsp:Transcript_17042/g.64966  ORF Transcript_17042/g.64966 Transcript_17042/m.64966 type:complete len:196 (-) Transcript_17042:396-983(-)
MRTPPPARIQRRNKSANWRNRRASLPIRWDFLGVLLFEAACALTGCRRLTWLVADVLVFAQQVHNWFTNYRKRHWSGTRSRAKRLRLMQRLHSANARLSGIALRPPQQPPAMGFPGLTMLQQASRVHLPASMPLKGGLGGSGLGGSGPRGYGGLSGPAPASTVDSDGAESPVKERRTHPMGNLSILQAALAQQGI